MNVPKFTSSRESCVLTSYDFLINYAAQQVGINQTISPSEIYNSYNRYFQQLHEGETITGATIIDWLKNSGLKGWYNQYKNDCEKIGKSYTNTYKVSDYKRTVRELCSSILFHYHCIYLKQGISGYQHLLDFHRYLIKSHKIFKNVELKVINRSFGQDNSIDIEVLKSQLLSNSDYLLLLLYQTNSGCHSIFVYTRGNSFYQQDPNIGEETSFDWQKVTAKEYVVFQYSLVGTSNLNNKNMLT